MARRPRPARSALRRLSRWAGVALLALALAALVALGLGPRSGRYQTLTVLSASMRPHITEGSLVVVTPKPAPDVRPGDVITFRAPIDGAPVVTHRVIEVRAVDGRPAVRTQADAGTEPDPWLASLAGEKVWVVRAAIPHAGRAVNQLRQPLARGVGGSAVLIALVAAWLVEIWRVPSPPCPALPPPRPWSWSRAARATVVVAGAVLGTGLASRRPRRG